MPYLLRVLLLRVELLQLGQLGILLLLLHQLGLDMGVLLGLGLLLLLGLLLGLGLLLLGLGLLLGVDQRLLQRVGMRLLKGEQASPSSYAKSLR